jgi:branched-chain amino acid aminotransferase
MTLAIEGLCYLNGAFVPLAEACLPVTDLGIQRGYGVFETLRTVDGQVYRLDAHLRRLADSAAAIALPLPWERAELAALVRETTRRAGYAEAALKILVTGGTPQGLMGVARPSLIIQATPFSPYPETLYAMGVSVITYAATRALAAAKTLDYALAVVAWRAALARGAHEALLVDHDLVHEGTTCNVFALVGGILVTPGRDVLPGITRADVLAVARMEGMPVAERDLALSELYGAEEVFLTSASRELLPVIQVDERSIGPGVPGTTTAALRRAYRAYVRAEVARELRAPG